MATVKNDADYEQAKADGTRLIGLALSAGADAQDVRMGLVAAVRESLEIETDDRLYAKSFRELLGELMGH